MNEFSDALIDTEKKGKIPKEYDWFGFLIGEWDILYSDNHGTGRERQVKANGSFHGFWMEPPFRTFSSVPRVPKGKSIPSPTPHGERHSGFSIPEQKPGIFFTAQPVKPNGSKRKRKATILS